MNERERKWNIHLVGLIIDLLFSLGEIFYIYLWLWIILTYKVFICQENDPWKVYVCTVLPPHLGLRRSQTIPPEGFIAHLWAVIEQSGLNIILGVIDYRHSSIFVDLSRSTSADVKQLTHRKLYHIHVVGVFKWEMSLLFNNLCLCDSNEEY